MSDAKSPLPPLTDEELGEIRRIAEKATAGPWLIEDGRGQGGPWDRITVNSGIARISDVVICIINHLFGPVEANAAFIARSRTDVIRLLDTIASLKSQLALATSKERELQAECDRYAAIMGQEITRDAQFDSVMIRKGCRVSTLIVAATRESSNG